MELRWYLNILKRRWPIVLALPLLVGVIAIFQDVTRDPVYSTEMRVSVIRQPEALPEAEFGYNGYYNYLASEFAIDDLVEAVRGNVFTDAVASRLPAESGIDSGEVQQALTPEREHRVLTMTAMSVDKQEAEAIAAATMSELQDHAFSFLGVEGIGSTAVVEVIQTPGEAVADTGRARLLLLLQVIAAMGAAVLLAFLVDYLDDTLYDAESTADVLRTPHLASIPAERHA